MCEGGRREPRKAAALQDWDEDTVVSKECSRLATRIVPPKAKAKREQRHPVQLRILILMAKMMMLDGQDGIDSVPRRAASFFKK